MMKNKLTYDEIQKTDTLLLQQEFAAIYWFGDMGGEDKDYLQLIINERIQRGEQQQDIDRQLDQLQRLSTAKTNTKNRGGG